MLLPQPPVNFLPSPLLLKAHFDNLGPLPPEIDDEIESIEDDTSEVELALCMT
jgi:hypothetical protein